MTTDSAARVMATIRQATWAVGDVKEAVNLLAQWCTRAEAALEGMNNQDPGADWLANELLQDGALVLQRAAKEYRLAGKRAVAIEWLRTLSLAQQKARDTHTAVEAALRLLRDKEAQ